MRRAVFLDRDDTLIRRKGGAPTGDLGDPGEFELIPGAREACERLAGAGFALVVVSNQGGVARGCYGVADVDRVHAEVNRLLGGLVGRFYFCPYHPEGTVPEFTREHPWRKPAPGMLLAAAGEMAIDLAESWMVGDSERDCEAGRAAGVRTVLVRRDGAPGGASGGGGGEFVVGSLAEAARVIVRAGHDRPSGSANPARGAEIVGATLAPKGSARERARPEQNPSPGADMVGATLSPKGRGWGTARRVVMVMPSWVGDVVMATPALKAVREGLPGAFIGALMRPGTEALLAGTSLVDEVHVDARAGMMGVKRAAGKLRARRYECAVLLANSFSSALTARVAGIPRRMGYERDARSLLLTDGLVSARRRDVEPYSRDRSRGGEWAPVPACEHSMGLARRLLGDESLRAERLILGTTEEEEREADGVLAGAGLAPGEAYALLNPGGNREDKRWPAERFAVLAAWLRERHGLRSVVSGAPGERELTERIARGAGDGAGAVSIAGAGVTIASLKAVVRRSRLMVTNDTGPRHIAAAFDVPVVTLFGPTDHRWTTIPCVREALVLADPTLPEELVADDHPERCAIGRIEVERVMRAVERVLGR